MLEKISGEGVLYLLSSDLPRKIAGKAYYPRFYKKITAFWALARPSHVAVLVPSVRKAADHLRQFDFQIAKEEEWDGEGTREIYVERDKANSLLLMEPIKPGAYQRVD